MKCYLCGKENLKVVRNKLRHNIQRNVLECQDCGLVYLEPKEENLYDYYDKEYHINYGPVYGKEISSQQNFESFIPFQEQNIDPIRKYLNPETKILDLGCSTGHFLYSLKNHVAERVGVEINKEQADFARKKLEIKILSEPIEKIDLPKEYFDIISSIHVIEHLDDPIKFFAKAGEFLKPNGYLYIKTPNIKDSLISVYKSGPYCDFWFREPHIYYFSPETLAGTLKKAGFEGVAFTNQKYSFLNHLSWIFTGKPQEAMDIGMSQSNLVSAEGADEQIKNDFNSWMQKINKEYFELLNKYGLGEEIIFIGKKVNN